MPPVLPMVVQSFPNHGHNFGKSQHVVRKVGNFRHEGACWPPRIIARRFSHLQTKRHVTAVPAAWMVGQPYHNTITCLFIQTLHQFAHSVKNTVLQIFMKKPRDSHEAFKQKRQKASILDSTDLFEEMPIFTTATLRLGKSSPSPDDQFVPYPTPGPFVAAGNDFEKNSVELVSASI